jgi:hypothetical protein
LKDFLLKQSLAIRTPVLPEVEKVVNSVTLDLHSISPYKTDIIKWLRPIINLEGYSVYPMNGCTEGLNWWYNQEYRGVHMEQGDYQWIKPTDRYGKIVYLSVPSAINGNYRELPIDVPIALDIAYVGSTKIQHIRKLDNVEYVFFSLSKAFGLRNVRTGWIFTKTPDERLESLTHSAKYYNYYAHNIAENVISNFDIDYIHSKLYNKQKAICEELDFVPSDSVWLATTKNKEYAKFMRDGKTARICLAESIK